MVAIVKVQQSSQNTSINLPKDVREALNIVKGDKLLVTVKDNQMIIEKIV